MSTRAAEAGENRGKPRVREAMVDAAFRRNVAWVQLLGLCPLLAVSNTIANAAGLAVASAFVLISSSVVVSSIRRVIHDDFRLPCFVLVIATFTTIATLAMEAWTFDLYSQIALFVQIIVTNCMILGRIEQSASKVSVPLAFIDAVATAAGFAIALLVLGAVRELATHAVPIAAMPAGAFIIAGLLLALGRTVVGAIGGKRAPDTNHNEEPDAAS